MSKRAIQKLFWTLLLGIVFIVYWIASRVTYLEKLREEETRVNIELQSVLQRNRVLKSQIELRNNEQREESARAAIEKNISALRELPFLKPVEYKRIPKSELRAYILSKLRIQYSSDEFKNYEIALKRIGLIPRTTDLMQAITSLLSEQVAAFYDQDTHELYTFPEFNLGNNMERMILAHELVHALQDQNFTLQKLPLRTKDNDDAALAAAALVEGDATYQMGVYLRENYNAEQWLGDLQMLFTQPMDQMQAAPAYLRSSLLFPYQDGQIFISDLHANGGNAAIDAAFKDPPESSKQILHPEKYMAVPRDRPQPVVFTFKPEPSWKKLHENVVGELGIRALFEDQLGVEKAQRVAAGWGGDRYVLYEITRDRWVLVWQTVWDAPKDAREFFNALDELYHARYRMEEGLGNKGEPADSIFFSVANQKQNITLFGRTVVLLDVPDAHTMAPLLQHFSKIKHL